MYYYYDKDYYGREHCYEVADDELRKDKENTLEELVNGELYPIWHLESWNDLDWDPDNEYERWLVKTITDFLGTGRTLPVIVITHFTSKPDERYECCNTEDEIPYDELIGEYAESHGYRKGPWYLSKDEYTVEKAEKCGMYALAELIDESYPYSLEGTIERIEDLDIEGMDVNIAWEKLKDLAANYLKRNEDSKLKKFVEFVMDKEQLGAYICGRISKGQSIDDLKRFMANVTPEDRYFWVNTKDELCGLDIYQMRREKHFMLEILKKRLEKEDEQAGID